MHRIKKPTGDVVRTTQPAHCVVWHPDDRNCAVCSTPQLRKRTKFKCETCNVYLHPKIAIKSFILKKNDKRDLCYILIYIYLRFVRIIDILHYK